MTTEEKQRFLYEEIIDAGLDAEEFQLFLENKNPMAGLDITRWDFSQLKKIVKQFKEKDKEPTSPVKKQSRPREEPQPKKEPIAQTKPVAEQNTAAKDEPAKQPEAKVGFGQKVPIKPKAPTEEKKEDKPVTQLKQPEKADKPKALEKTKQPEKPPASQKLLEKQQPPKSELEQKPKQQKPEPEVNEDQYNVVDSATKQQIFNRSLNCERMELSLLFNLDITVEIKKYEIVQGGLFSQTYAIYTIDTPKQGWSVTRRYNDFVWLRETLEKLHPGLPIPPIANKSSYRKFTETHLKRRMMMMETFLNKILTVPDLKGEIIICNFLRIADNLEYLKFKKEFTVEERLRPDKLRTLKGKVNLIIEPKVSKFIGLARQNFANSEPRLRKVYKEAKAVSKLLDGSANLLESMSKTFQQLSEQNHLFNKISELNIRSSSSYLYDILKGLTHSLAYAPDLLSKTFTDQSQLIYKYFYGTYKYECANVMSTLESLGKLEIARGEYRDFKAKLKRTKEKLLEDRNYSKWGMTTLQTERLTSNKEASFDRNELLGMMLPKESEQEIQLKEMYALMNFHVYEELSRFSHHNPKFLSGTLMEMCKKQSRLSSESMMLWADTMTGVMSFQEGRRVCEIEITQTSVKK